MADLSVLAGKRVVILRESDFSVDSRNRKLSQSLASAGAQVRLVGRGETVAEDLMDGPAEIVLIPGAAIKHPRLGHESVWWPLRVAVNLTYRYFGYPRRVARYFDVDAAMLEAATGFDPDIIIAEDTYTLATAVEVKRTLGCALLYDVRDLVSDVSYGDDLTRARLRALEDELIHVADEVTAVSEPMAEVLRSRHRLDNVTAVHNGPAWIADQPSSTTLPVKLLFQGAFEEDRNLPMHIQAVALMDTPVILTLQGFGLAKAELQKLAETLGIQDSVRFADPVAPSHVVRAAHEHDIGLVTLQAGTLNHEVTVPNKLTDYLGAGLSVAATYLPGSRSILEGTSIVHWVDPSSAELLAESLDAVASRPEAISQAKRQSLELATAFAWEVQGVRYLAAIARALESRTAMREQCDLSALPGARICLVRETRVLYHARFMRQIRLLQKAGASLTLLTGNPDPHDQPPGVRRIFAPLDFSRILRPALIPASEHPVRSIRIASNLVRNPLRRVAVNLWLLANRPISRRKALRHLAPETDLFWVVDFPALESTMDGAKRWGNERVLYDTIDLVPEYNYRFIPEAKQIENRRTERRLIGHVSGFVTAAESYADYYDEKYGDVPGYRRPFVFGNAPEIVVDEPRIRSRVTRFLFLGALAFNRPIAELIEAASLCEEEIEITFQGENLIGSEPDRLIAKFGVEDRVRVVEACPVDRIVEVAAEYDVGIVALEGANENQRRAETTKIYTYMAAGLAILGSDLPGIRRVVDSAGNGLLVDRMDPEKWAQRMDELVRMDDSELAVLKYASLEFARESRPSTQARGLICEFERAVTSVEVPHE